jgi:curved DNA-binding protein CbpA
MSRAEIRQRYIALARMTHPDSPSNSDDTTTTAANSNYNNNSSNSFDNVARAWEVLSDTQSRRVHDRELAALQFKDNISRMANVAVREVVGPTFTKFYDDVAIPLFKRSAATTLASWSAVVNDEEEKNNDGEEEEEEKRIRRLSGVTLSDVVKEASDIQQRGGGSRRGSNSGSNGVDTFGKAFQRVITATRRVDGEELKSKGEELGRKADETLTKAEEIFCRLTNIRLERLRLTLQSSSIDFTSADASAYLGGLCEIDDDGCIMPTSMSGAMMQRMSLRHSIWQDIEAFVTAELDVEAMTREKTEVDYTSNMLYQTMDEAEHAVQLAIEAEELAKRVLEDATKCVIENQKMLLEAKRSVRDIDTVSKKTEYELTKANAMLKRKRDAVRRELRRKSENIPAEEYALFNHQVKDCDELPTFDREDDGRIRLSSSSMDAMGFEDGQTRARIELLKKEEDRMEEEYTKLVDKATRLTSRSEKLRLRSDELIGRQQS